MVCHPILKRLQRMTAGFVVGRYATEQDVWHKLPLSKLRGYILISAWPSYLKLEQYIPTKRTLRSSSESKCSHRKRHLSSHRCRRVQLLACMFKLETLGFTTIFKKLINNSCGKYKRNECLINVYKTH